MISFDLNQAGLPPKYRWSRARLAKLARALDKRVPQAPTGAVDINFVSDAEIKRLNRMYRKRDKITDVLSFQSPESDLSGHLGDVLICYDQAVRQAEDGDIELELTDLLVHGILHVLGYDHELAADAERMFPLQDALVNDLL